MSSRLAALLVLAASALPGLAGADVSLRGRITDAAGDPLSGVVVMITPQDDGAPRKAVTTRDDGAFEARGLPPGTYRIVASKPGYASATIGAHELAATGARPISLALTESEQGAIKISHGKASGSGPAGETESPITVEVRDEANDFDLQMWLNEKSAARLELLAIVPGADATSWFVFREAKDPAPPCTVIAVSEPLEPERLRARIALQPQLRFVGIHRLREGVYALVFAASR